MKRCVNIDWLELYCTESIQRYPCNADYFRNQGYYVRERDYGTRVWREMFIIEDDEGQPYIEIRRNPASGEADINGLVPESCHIRFNNRACYYSDCIQRMRDFLLQNDYVFRRIFRIDICYDFRLFDYGDAPAKFARRYIERRYRKINQCKLTAIGDDNWATFDWESLSWGSKHSMVSTKMYNKVKEMSTAESDKPYIRQVWFEYGLIDDPVNLLIHQEDGSKVKADIWRIEFSLKSGVNGFVIIENQDRKRSKKTAVPHTLDLYDSPDKLWARFEELAYHYFHFKYYEEGKRKDRCKDKLLFKFSERPEFLQVSNLAPRSKPEQDDIRLAKLLSKWREFHFDQKVRAACDVVLSQIDRSDLRRVLVKSDPIEIQALQRAISARMGGDSRSAVELIAYFKKLLSDEGIF